MAIQEDIDPEMPNLKRYLFDEADQDSNEAASTDPVLMAVEPVKSGESSRKQSLRSSDKKSSEASSSHKDSRSKTKTSSSSRSHSESKQNSTSVTDNDLKDFMANMSLQMSEMQNQITSLSSSVEAIKTGKSSTEDTTNSPPEMEAAGNSSEGSEEEGEVSEEDDDPFAADDPSSDEEEEDEMVKEIIDNLRSIYKLEEKKGKNVSDLIAKTITGMMSSPLSETELDTILSTHLSPGNITCLNSNRVNGEVWKHVPTALKNTDSGVQKAQLCNLKSIIPLIYLFDVVKGKPYAKPVLNAIKDSIILSLGCNDLINKQRRNLLRPFFNDDYKAIANNAPGPSTSADGVVEPPKLLFGDDLKSQVESLTTSNILSNKIGKKNTQVTTRGLF